MGFFSNITAKISRSFHARRDRKLSNVDGNLVLHHKEYLLTDNAPFDVTEAFRNLKAALSVSVPKKDGGMCVTTTSAYPKDGKTTVAVNLALMFALSDAKVIIVDADIRKGRVAKFFKQRSAPGLADYLSGQNTLEEVIRPTSINKNLSYIACGTHSPKPYELLESEEMKNLLETLRTQYDYIIVDTPPVLLLSDALVVAPETDGTVLVCRHQVSYMSDIDRALNSLSFAQAKVLGVVVNDYTSPKFGKSYNRYKNRYYYTAYTYTRGPEDDDPPTDTSSDKQ